MNVYQGKSVFGGIAIGHLCVYQKGEQRVTRQKIDEVLNDGFEAVQMGRALLNEPGFVNRMRMEENARCSCKQ